MFLYTVYMRFNNLYNVIFQVRVVLTNCMLLVIDVNVVDRLHQLIFGSFW